MIADLLGIRSGKPLITTEARESLFSILNHIPAKEQQPRNDQTDEHHKHIFVWKEIGHGFLFLAVSGRYVWDPLGGQECMGSRRLRIRH